MFIRSIIRPAAVAIAITIGLASFSALADEGKPGAAKVGQEASEHHKKHEKHFPMKADEFEKMLDRRIEHARARMEKIIVERKLPDAVAKQVKQDFENGAAAVRAMAKRVEADGTVTKEEAKEVRELAKDLRKKAAEKYGMGRKHPGNRARR